MATWKNKEAAAAAARAYRARNREKIRAKDRERDRSSARRERHRQAASARYAAMSPVEKDRVKARGLAWHAEQWQRFLVAMTPSDEDRRCDHEAWLEGLDYLDDDLLDTRAW